MIQENQRDRGRSDDGQTAGGGEDDTLFPNPDPEDFQVQSNEHSFISLLGGWFLMQS